MSLLLIIREWRGREREESISGACLLPYSLPPALIFFDAVALVSLENPGSSSFHLLVVTTDNIDFYKTVDAVRIHPGATGAEPSVKEERYPWGHDSASKEERRRRERVVQSRGTRRRRPDRTRLLSLPLSSPFVAHKESSLIIIPSLGVRWRISASASVSLVPPKKKKHSRRSFPSRIVSHTKKYLD